MQEKGWKNIFHVNGKQNRAWVAILIANKINFKSKNFVRTKTLYIDKSSINQENVTIS